MDTTDIKLQNAADPPRNTT